jgi:hypothetical protein
MADRASRRALVASALLHAALAVTVAGSASRAAEGQDRISEAWSGTTFDISDFEVPALRGAEEELAATGALEPPAGHADPPSAEAPLALEQSARPPRVRSTPKARLPNQPAEGGAESLSGASGSGSREGRDLSGAAGLPPGIRELSKAFTRAIPFASRADVAWQRWALGHVGKVRVEIRTDGEGRIVSVEPLDEVVAAPLLRLVERTALLLRRGQFALADGVVGSGTEVLEIEATLFRVEADHVYADSEHALRLDYEPPTRGRPGRAAFELGTGRRLEVTVRVDEEHAMR